MQTFSANSTKILAHFRFSIRLTIAFWLRKWRNPFKFMDFESFRSLASNLKSTVRPEFQVYNWFDDFWTLWQSAGIEQTCISTAICLLFVEMHDFGDPSQIDATSHFEGFFDVWAAWQHARISTCLTWTSKYICPSQIKFDICKNLNCKNF